jgi:hypothetical protein
MSKDTNEMATAGEKSFLKLLVQNPTDCYIIDELDIQYRMHLSIGTSNGQLFYPKPSRHNQIP